MLQRGIFRTQSNSYDEPFLRKQLTGDAINCFHLTPKISILDVWLSYKYASVASLNSCKDIFQSWFDANP